MIDNTIHAYLDLFVIKLNKQDFVGPQMIGFKKKKNYENPNCKISHGANLG